MTNYERWKDEVIKIIAAANPVAVVNGIPTACKPNIACSTCDLRPNNVCSDKLAEWFKEEYVERPKLTQREHKLCEVIETGWIARDISNALFCYKEMPSKGENSWYAESRITKLNHILPGGFAFIKWNDEEPWSVSDLLKLEVSDE